jgi:hypothetical protein
MGRRFARHVSTHEFEEGILSHVQNISAARLSAAMVLYRLETNSASRAEATHRAAQYAARSSG